MYLCQFTIFGFKYFLLKIVEICIDIASDVVSCLYVTNNLTVEQEHGSYG